MYRRNLRTCFVLAQGILWFHLSILGLKAASRETPSVSFETWKQKCNCSCLNERSPVGKFKGENCVQKEIFEIDNEGNILKSKPFHLNLFELAVGSAMCSTTTDAEEDFNLRLVTLNCVTSERDLGRTKRKRFYTILRQRNSGELLQKRTYKSLLYAASYTDQTEEKTNKRSAPSATLIVGLSVGLALVVGVVVSLLCIRRHSTRKPPHEDTEKNEQNNDINEEEDSHPYRIVDLATQIAYDSAGYTFLEASKKEEENPYQKLNATKSIVLEKKESVDLAAIEADEPVYYVLEA